MNTLLLISQKAGQLITEKGGNETLTLLGPDGIVLR